MLSELNQSPVAAQSDAEFEWLLCLAAAQQAPQQGPATFAIERRLPPKPTFLPGLHALLSGVRWVKWI